jgi:hypothetical protein
MIQVRRKSSGAITAIRFKRERPDIANHDEFHADVAPTLWGDRHGGKFLYKPLTFDDLGGWCTVRPA